MPSKDPLYHPKVRKLNSTTHYRLAANGFISHMLEKRPRRERDVGADHSLSKGRSRNLELKENAAGCPLALAVFMHVEHVYVAVFSFPGS